MIRAATLPGWVLTPGVQVWHDGTLVADTDDLGTILGALGPSTLATERVASAAAGLLHVSVDAGQALIAVPRTAAALAWRFCLVNQAVAAGYRVTFRPDRVLSCDAVWTYAASPVLEPLWCTAAVADIPLIWVPYTALAAGLPWAVGGASSRNWWTTRRPTCSGILSRS